MKLTIRFNTTRKENGPSPIMGVTNAFIFQTYTFENTNAVEKFEETPFYNDGINAHTLNNIRDFFLKIPDLKKNT
jgi:hypothetical protein